MTSSAICMKNPLFSQPFVTLHPHRSSPRQDKPQACCEPKCQYCYQSLSCKCLEQ
ncbi:hypothetical protein D0Y65_045506 [Glycine soja]|uniref:Uncharacterized protein n=2 Tax=Glycine subgen. Soja TaxID=1462606 RepID=A0A0R0FBU0_SOYBN|nr:hypothetical protein D0Y65_045506 [Glycine soja]